jgi:hypothetical protein
VLVFVVTTVTVVFGCWCGGRKRRKQYHFDLPEKGIPSDDEYKSKEEPNPKVTVLGERKV